MLFRSPLQFVLNDLATKWREDLAQGFNSILTLGDNVMIIALSAIGLAKAEMGFSGRCRERNHCL
jgi:hypothetical protein